MLFNSFEFLSLLVPTFIIYYLLPRQSWQLKVLIFSSFVFYAYHEPWLLSLLLGSILINSVSSYQIAKNHSPKLWAWIGVGLNLGTLVFFKYSGMLSLSFLSPEQLSTDLGRTLLSIPLPIGISFFTFQGISLVVNVYKNPHDPRLGEIKSFASHLEKTAMFKAFFPQLIAGPIVQAQDFYFQMQPKLFSKIDWNFVLKNLVLGYFLKCVIADNLKDQTFWIAYPYFATLSTADLVVLLFAYSAQIFADFAGYSYIALGLAGLFGYVLVVNFNWPYISQSFSEFWRRWHISLSTFLRDYLYIPLGGSRKGNVRTYINLFIVMFLGGLWHGAAWSYAVWGTSHGLALAIERFFGLDRPESKNIFVKFFRIGLVFTYVTFVWLLFNLPEFQHVLLYFKSMASNLNLPLGKRRALLSFIYFLPVLFLHLYYLCKKDIPAERKKWLEAAGYSVMLFLILTSAGGPGAFIYFQF